MCQNPKEKFVDISFLEEGVVGDRSLMHHMPPHSTTSRCLLRVSQGFWGTREHWQNMEGNKGTLANFWEQGNKIRKITVRKHSERVWEHGNIGQFWKGTREQGPPLGDPLSCTQHTNCPFRSSKKDWVLVCTLLKLHLIKKITQPPDISLKN